MKKITVFTPTYNRAYCLEKLYSSLTNQTMRDFVWLIIDDGSSDNTKSIVQKWQTENIIEIRYIYKKNGGMHTAHNLAYKNIDTELNVCIDSDDTMPRCAIEDILSLWEIHQDNHIIAGFIGLDSDEKGNIIGTKLPDGVGPTTLDYLYQKENIKGDKKVVLRTSVVKEYPLYPEFDGEKLVPLDVLYSQIGQDYKFITRNAIWCVVDYQPDGSSASIINQYFQSPNGFRYSRVMSYKNGFTFKNKVRNIIHYNISIFILRDFKSFISSPSIGLTIVLSPLSFIVFLYLRFKATNV